MTIYPIDQALVMDTDDIPGRGGYAVVGLSKGVVQSERVFVSQNFGISDFLHDPRNDRVFYSFLRVPNGRWALIRRYPKGTRRNGTQNRVFVHTLFIDEPLFAAVDGLPWVLLESKLREQGSDQWRPLTLESVTPPPDGTIPYLEWKSEEADLAETSIRRLTARLSHVARRLGEVRGLEGLTPAEAVAAVIAGLERHGRVLLPQGPVFEQLTLLAWSMMTPRDRRELAWTQHDDTNASSLTFALANVPYPAHAAADGSSAHVVDLLRDATPVSLWVVEMSGTSAEDRREFQKIAEESDLTASGDAVGRWLAWRENLKSFVESVDQPDKVVIQRLKNLADCASVGRNDPWVRGMDVLQPMWSNVTEAVRSGKEAKPAVYRWASMLHPSTIDGVIFRQPPRPGWLDEKAAEVGYDNVVAFFILGTEAANARPTREAVAAWLLDARSTEQRVKIDDDRLAQLSARLARDDSRFTTAFVQWLLGRENGLGALEKKTPKTEAFGPFILMAAREAIAAKHRGAREFVTNALLPQLEANRDLRKGLGASANAIGEVLRGQRAAYVRFLSLLDPSAAEALVGNVVQWLTEKPRDARPLGCELLRAMSDGRLRPVNLTTLAFAVAASGEPDRAWFSTLLRVANAIDQQNDVSSAERFRQRIDALARQGIDLTGAIEPLAEFIENAADTNARIGRSAWTVFRLSEPVWSSAARILEPVHRLLIHARLVAQWESVMIGLARSLGERHRKDVAAIVYAFWDRLDENALSNVSSDAIAAIRVLSDGQRNALITTWAQRLRRGTRSERADELVAALTRSQSDTKARELRIPPALREVNSGVATEATLNRLDSDLANARPARYRSEMSAALETYAGKGSASKRVNRLMALLDSALVLPTVKLLIETKVLSSLIESFSEQELDQVVASLAAGAFRRPLVALVIAEQLAWSGSEGAQNRFMDACREYRRSDAAHELYAAHQRKQPSWQRVKRAFGSVTHWT